MCQMKQSEDNTPMPDDVLPRGVEWVLHECERDGCNQIFWRKEGAHYSRPNKSCSDECTRLRYIDIVNSNRHKYGEKRRTKRGYRFKSITIERHPFWDKDGVPPKELQFMTPEQIIRLSEKGQLRYE